MVPSRARSRFVYLLHVAQRRVEAEILARTEGHTAARAGLLMALTPGSATPMARLARDLDLGAPAVSNLVERAVRAGLVARAADPDDGRAWNVALTAAGEAARKEAVAGARALNARLCEGFSEAELEIVARWLEAARSKFPRHEEDAKENER